MTEQRKKENGREITPSICMVFNEHKLTGPNLLACGSSHPRQMVDPAPQEIELAFWFVGFFK